MFLNILFFYELSELWGGATSISDGIFTIKFLAHECSCWIEKWYLILFTSKITKKIEALKLDSKEYLQSTFSLYCVMDRKFYMFICLKFCLSLRSFCQKYFNLSDKVGVLKPGVQFWPVISLVWFGKAKKLSRVGQSTKVIPGVWNVD